MANIAQLVERQIVALDAVGSNPAIRPIFGQVVTMLIEVFGPAGAGKSFLLDKLADKVKNVIFPRQLCNKKKLKSLINAIPASYEYKTDLSDFIIFCIDSINHSSMSSEQKTNAMTIVKNCYNAYLNVRKLDKYGYVVMSDELLLHRSLSFLMYSDNLEKDTVKFFQLAPLPDVVCIFSSKEEIIKKRTLMRPYIPNCYSVNSEEEFDEVIRKAVQICKIGEETLKERGIDVTYIDLSDNLENTVERLVTFLDKKINQHAAVA